ncbi:MAG: flagellar basal body-associated FliL family protein [Oscillospiraceae bacterium]|nr:flagellar basal body-associated FliL family protein [Oscillospiraceae bacterium]
MEKKSSFLIFLVIIAFLTLIIAALVTFIMLVGINGPALAAEGAYTGRDNEPYVLAGEPPDEASLATIALLESGQPINLMTSDPSKPSYALVEMSVKYYVKIDGIKDVQAKMNLNKANLQEIVTTYFMAMDVDEFSRFETKARVKDELKQELNEFLLTTISGEKDRRKVKEVIYDVVFSAWNYQ